ncbi:hypothetical protein PAPYR_288 [Paratrimastix pyriformis]|uniref:Cap-specific mRNA (nucleoside-2'-O-)-methyltransferase 1 n=1 Tax=Paratrimastix pyriformis TaxID=342808 RepID=A0ABQ8UWT4_9EUKA|nr:hypothetical protein PAPYR_288 [Paratrimastix pyriformis]
MDLNPLAPTASGMTESVPKPQIIIFKKSSSLAEETQTPIDFSSLGVDDIDFLSQSAASLPKYPKAFPPDEVAPEHEDELPPGSSPPRSSTPSGADSLDTAIKTLCSPPPPSQFNWTIFSQVADQVHVQETDIAPVELTKWRARAQTELQAAGRPEEELEEARRKSAMPLAHLDALAGLARPADGTPLTFVDLGGGPGAAVEYLAWRAPDYRAWGCSPRPYSPASFSLRVSHASFAVEHAPAGTGPDDVRIGACREHLVETVRAATQGRGVHLVLAHGPAQDRAGPEETLAPCLLAQIATAFAVLHRGGRLVCRLGDVHTPLTAGLLYMVHLHFARMAIVRPAGCLAQGYRYLVALDFLCDAPPQGAIAHLLGALAECERGNQAARLFPVSSMGLAFTHYLGRANARDVEHECRFLEGTLAHLRDAALAPVGHPKAIVDALYRHWNLLGPAPRGAAGGLEARLTLDAPLPDHYGSRGHAPSHRSRGGPDRGRGGRRGGGPWRGPEGGHRSPPPPPPGSLRDRRGDAQLDEIDAARRPRPRSRSPPPPRRPSPSYAPDARPGPTRGRPSPPRRPQDGDRSQRDRRQDGDRDGDRSRERQDWGRDRDRRPRSRSPPPPPPPPRGWGARRS